MTSGAKADIAVIGMAVMGKNLALNMADHGQRVAIYNRSGNVTDEVMAENPAKKLVPAKTLPDLVASLERPRRLLVMVKAGAPVDAVLGDLVPLLEPGDVVIDGGNTFFPETQRREKALRDKKLHFVGMGVSGGEEGARFGPSLMPGGAKEAWDAIRPIFEAISAKTDSGACVTHVGPDGAGHFVKMVHNGIEYGDMQLIAEAYDLMSRGLSMSASEIGDVFTKWNQGPLESFLIEITGKVLAVTDPQTKKALVDLVEDRAGQKGTGKWTVQVALDLAVPIPTIAAAIDARVLSSMKDERIRASARVHGAVDAPKNVDKAATLANIHDALFAAKIGSYAQGLKLIRAASDEQKWGIDLKEMARIWKGGCIIRAKLLDTIMRAFDRDPKLESILADPELEKSVLAAQPGWRRAVAFGTSLGIPLPATTASLSYFDSYRTPRLPQNLTQAQRDAFGAHTYQRIDKPELGFVHTDWLGVEKK
ncbi:MAG: NADP-dependent phosphogluconate dehydrogenase [Polyangiaceae bacterium]|nr:NADP-dependent phosphogluconate dehydrogenase [Polyangiaceae bacterium]